MSIYKPLVEIGEERSGGVVRGTGFEPARLAALAPKASVSANSTIPAKFTFQTII
jgi:hypothetical protein